MDAELHWKGLVYDAAARLLPTMGRDYTLDVTVTPENGQFGIHITLSAKTEIGRMFAKYLQQHLAEALGNRYAGEEHAHVHNRSEEAGGRIAEGSQERVPEKLDGQLGDRARPDDRSGRNPGDSVRDAPGVEQHRPIRLVAD